MNYSEPAACIQCGAANETMIRVGLGEPEDRGNGKSFIKVLYECEDCNAGKDDGSGGTGS